MGKRFNDVGLCRPSQHYMVNIKGRLEKIKKLIDEGAYFVMNRARQYGKSTTLAALRNYLSNEYTVILLSFQRLSTAKFRDEHTFAVAFAQSFLTFVENKKKNVEGLDENLISSLRRELENDEAFDLVELFRYLSALCDTSSKPVVLMIDEVDQASNNQVFLDFLAQLRDLYLDREDTPTFQSVVLAGVYDIKNLKLKIRPDTEHRYNSPWNIATEFNIDMSFSAEEIAGMLTDYEQDRRTGMDIRRISVLIYEYTSGYPYLVSCICKLIDEKLIGTEAFADEADAWTKSGIIAAVKELISNTNTLFDDMRKKVTDYPELREMLYAILFTGKSIPYNPDNFAIQIGSMFGFIKERQGIVTVANRIFETRLYNYFLSEELMNSIIYQAAALDKNQFVKNGILDMDMVLKKFVHHFTEIYAGSDDKFIEENGRRLFLLYLKPIINGTGNYYIEARTRDLRRTDVIIDYLGQQSIVEMKIWHGNEYNKRGEEQLAGYLDDYKLDKGYMLSFNFNKKKDVGIKEIRIGNKLIIEAVV